MEPHDLTAAPLANLPARAPDSHKGDYGRVLLVGGSTGMSGAIALAGKSALRSGAGLVTLAVPTCIRAEVAAHDPCYMTVGLYGNEAGRLGPMSGLELPAALVEQASAWGVGPGMGTGESTATLVGRLYQQVKAPLVVDADGLGGLTSQPDLIAHPGGPRVLTPHPGEFARLATALDPNWQTASGTQAHDDQQRIAAAVWLASCDPNGHTTVVLKGHRTVVAQSSRVSVNQTGNPGMATGGSGDVLTGVITGLLAQGFTAWDAARTGVHVHGLAGDLAADSLGQTSLTAGDLVDSLPEAFCQLARDTRR